MTEWLQQARAKLCEIQTQAATSPVSPREHQTRQTKLQRRINTLEGQISTHMSRLKREKKAAAVIQREPLNAVGPVDDANRPESGGCHPAAPESNRNHSAHSANGVQSVLSQQATARSKQQSTLMEAAKAARAAASHLTKLNHGMPVASDTLHTAATQWIATSDSCKIDSSYALR